MFRAELNPQAPVRVQSETSRALHRAVTTFRLAVIVIIIIIIIILFILMEQNFY
jgi:hypothetical protein